MYEKITIKESGYDGGGKMQYRLFVDDVFYCMAYFNMSGYVAEKGVPVPHAGGSIGRWVPECNITRLKMEIKSANAEWRRSMIPKG